MREKLVLDTGVLSLHFADDPSVRHFFDAVISGRSLGLITSVTLTEFYYKTCQKLGRESADARYFWLRDSQLQVVDVKDLARGAGLEKCRGSHSLSMADCFALSLAKAESAELVTTDAELARAAGTAGRHIRLD